MDVFYRILNVPMTALLRSPAHGIGSRALCLLTYTGRVSGRTITTPLSYTREGDVVRLLSSDKTRWWKNFPEPDVGDGEMAESAGAPVEVEIAREVFRGTARTFTRDSAHFRNGVRTFLTRLPRDAVVYGISLDGDNRPREEEIETASGHVVLVEVTLEGD